MKGRLGAWGMAALSWGAEQRAWSAEPEAPPAAATDAKPELAPPPAEERPRIAPPATGPIPTQRIAYESTLGARLNPLGLELQYSLAYRHRLYASDSAALRDNYFGVVLNPTLNPAITRFGVALEFRPLTLLQFQGGVHQVGYVGSFKHLQTFPSASADFSDTARDVRGDAGANHPRHGLEAFARTVALAKLGPIVIRDDLMFTYSKLALTNDDPVYYHPRFDVLAPDSGWFLHNDSDVVFMSDFGLIAGVRNSLTHAFIPDEALGGSAAEDNSPMLRLGPLAAFTIFDHPGERFNKPTIIAMAQWWLLHRFRTGEDVHQGIPLVTIAFRFEGDLWAVK